MTEWWQQFEATLAAAECALERERQSVVAAGDPWPPQHQQEPQVSAADVEFAGRAARLAELLSQVTEAADRLAAENAEQGARTDYAARIDREAGAEPEPKLRPQAQEQAEAEP